MNDYHINAILLDKPAEEPAWVPKPGERIRVKMHGADEWEERVFVRHNANSPHPWECKAITGPGTFEWRIASPIPRAASVVGKQDNGAAQRGGVREMADGESATHHDGFGHMPAIEAAGSTPAAAPPFQPGEAAHPQNAAEHWVPWHGGECPVPHDTKVCVILQDGDQYRGSAHHSVWSHDEDVMDYWSQITAYRLANPTPRGPCQLPADHPHAALERLYMSDDTLRVWCRSDKYGHPAWGECCPFWGVEFGYYVGHVPPKGAV